MRIPPAIWMCLVVFLGNEALAIGDMPSVLKAEDGMEMVLVEAGDFVMGTGRGLMEESPAHVRSLPSFYIDRTEVTCGQYARYVGATGTEAPPDWIDGRLPVGRDMYPITNISWFDAMRYAIWAGKRLPTEAEWERAARGTDGRVFPWGDADDASKRNRDSGKLMPVGQFPAGRSPSGCLDMSGNAWEWTADWFDPYPGNTDRSVHFGRQYKVIRGGAGEYLYATSNTGTTTQRARLVPYGGHDFVGFRCVKDVPGASPPYEPRELLPEAEKQLQGYLREPRELEYEGQYKQLLEEGKIPLTVYGRPGQYGHVRTGLPLPEGLIGDMRVIRLNSVQGTSIPVQASVLSRWSDGTVRWALLDFCATAGKDLYVDFRARQTAGDSATGVRVRREDDRVVLDNGQVAVDFGAGELINEIRVDRERVVSGVSLELEALLDQGSTGLTPMTPESLRVEDEGPEYAQVRLIGYFQDDRHDKTAMKYDLRIGLSSGSRQVNLKCTIVHDAHRQEPWDEMKPHLSLSDARLSFALEDPVTECVFGQERGQKHLTLEEGIRAELLQSDDLTYQIRSNASTVARGARAPGWLAVGQGPHWIGLGVRHFWQNHPASLAAGDGGISARLYAGSEPFPWEGGLAKTHEVLLSFGARPESVTLGPLRAVIDPIWACGSQAAGALLPRCAESLETLPYWECWRDTAMRKWVNAMPFGGRHFGDGYMGGPYKGKNAYVNLEYDVPWNFLMQFLRTGDVWFLEMAEPMVRHQADVDTENAAGFAWKHSPSHTTTKAELGHVFIRGLLLYHVLTGDRRCLETAEKIGHWVAGMLERGQGVGNERQIGWSLYALTALYDVTGEKQYLNAAETLANRLMAGQSPTGKFDIRWDNRIAFFNGIAMNGMLGVQQINGSEALEQCVIKVADRTLGMYPEYACRTLNAFCWAVTEHRDPRIIDNMERTWNSSMEFLLDRDCTTAETHAWQFPRFAAKYGLYPVFASRPKALPDASSWKCSRFLNPQVELYLRPRDSANIMVIREGLATGHLELWDMSGELLLTRRIAQADQMFEAHALSLPGTGRVYRIRLSSPKAFGWQIHCDRQTDVTVYDPQNVQMPFLLNRAYGSVQSGASKVVVKFEAMGEGFHSAVLYDPNGSPVRAVRHFVDFEDPGRYELILEADVIGPNEGWSLELNHLKVLQIEGFLPYWSNRSEELFNPEHIVGRP